MRSTLRLVWIVSAVALVQLLSLDVAVQAREAVVVTNDGRTFTGQVVSEDEKAITLVISNIRTPIPKSDVKSIEYVLSMREQFEQKRAAIQDDDVDERYKLAMWLFENRALELARQELDDMSKRFPEENRVALLSRAVAEQMKRASEEATPSTDPQSAAPTPRPGEPTRRTTRPIKAADLPSEMLSEDDVRLLKVYEVNMSGRSKPNISVDRETREALLKNYAQDEQVPKGRSEHAQFMRAQGWEVLDLMFRVKARELYAKVNVVSEPEAFRTFRTSVHRRYVLNYCGTTLCHGGPDAGSFFLFNDNSPSEKTAYTNFYILHQSAVGNGLMIDRDDPMRSLLIQYGLPTESASMPHPGPDKAKGWRPHFTGLQDNRLQATVKWIETLYRPTPDYGISYQPPSLTPPAGPATDAPPAPDAPPATPAPVPAP